MEGLYPLCSRPISSPSSGILIQHEADLLPNLLITNIYEYDLRATCGWEPWSKTRRRAVSDGGAVETLASENVDEFDISAGALLAIVAYR